jgi:hypothetical protein
VCKWDCTLLDDGSHEPARTVFSATDDPPGRASCEYLRLISPILPHMSRYDQPGHWVFMTFFYRAGWQVQFTEADFKNPLPRKFTFADAEKIRELARRGEAWGDSESRQILEHATETGRERLLPAANTWAVQEAQRVGARKGPYSDRHSSRPPVLVLRTRSTSALSSGLSFFTSDSASFCVLQSRLARFDPWRAPRIYRRRFPR